MSESATPYETGQTRAPSPPSHLDFLAMDFESLKRRAIRFVVEQFPDDYNNFSESDYGIFLLELWAFIADHISFKVDYSANQVFRINTTELDHMMRLANLTGYHPRPPTAAMAWVAATIDSPTDDDVLIPAGYIVEARGEGGGISFELYPADASGEPMMDTDSFIPAGSVVNTNILAVEGETRIDEFVSDGNPHQRFQTANESVIYGSVRVLVNSAQWTGVEYFRLGSDQTYTVRNDSTYRAEVTFGDNIYGVVPPQGAALTISYRIGGGRVGNIIRGAINENSVFSLVGGQGTVAVTISNYEKSDGGSDGEGLEDIRRNMPIPIRTQNRLVTGEDYKSYAENYTSVYHGKVGKASSALRQFGCAANVIDIYILEDDGGGDLLEPSSELKDELFESMNEIKMMTDHVCVKSGEKITQDLSLGVLSSRSYTREKAGIEQNIRDRVESFFRLDNWYFGKSLRKSELLRYLSGIPEITSLDVVLESNAADLDPDPDIVEVSADQIIRPGNIQISFTFE